MIYVLNNSLKVQEYQRILKVSETEIVLLIDNKTLYILGDDLIINEFEADEFSVKGNINSLIFK